jgi:hypothetical protein
MWPLAARNPMSFRSAADSAGITRDMRIPSSGSDVHNGVHARLRPVQPSPARADGASIALVEATVKGVPDRPPLVLCTSNPAGAADTTGRIPQMEWAPCRP